MRKKRREAKRLLIKNNQKRHRRCKASAIRVQAAFDDLMKALDAIPRFPLLSILLHCFWNAVRGGLRKVR